MTGPKVEDQDQAIDFISKAQKELKKNDADKGFQAFREMLGNPDDPELSNGAKKIIKKFNSTLPDPNSGGYKNTAGWSFWSFVPFAKADKKWECNEKLGKKGCNVIAQSENQRLNRLASTKVRELSDHAEASRHSKLLKENRELEENVKKIDTLYGRDVLQEFSELDLKADDSTKTAARRGWFGSLWHYSKLVLKPASVLGLLFMPGVAGALDGVDGKKLKSGWDAFKDVSKVPKSDACVLMMTACGGALTTGWCAALCTPVYVYVPLGIAAGVWCWFKYGWWGNGSWGKANTSEKDTKPGEGSTFWHNVI